MISIFYAATILELGVTIQVAGQYCTEENGQYLGKYYRSFATILGFRDAGDVASGSSEIRTYLNACPDLVRIQFVNTAFNKYPLRRIYWERDIKL